MVAALCWWRRSRSCWWRRRSARTSTGGWERLCYIFPLFYGYLIASDRRFEAALRRARRPALAGALLATAALAGWAGMLRRSGVDVMSGTARGWSALQGVAGWLWVTAILGFAGALMAHRAGHSATRAADSVTREPPSRRAARYANQAVLPCYLLHEPIIVAIAWVIVGWHLPILAKYPLLVITSFAGTLLLYEALIRRFRPTRFLFGMKPPQPADPRQSADQAIRSLSK